MFTIISLLLAPLDFELQNKKASASLAGAAGLAETVSFLKLVRTSRADTLLPRRRSRRRGAK